MRLNQTNNLVKRAAAIGVISLGAIVCNVTQAQPADAKPDNTAVNQRDRESGQVTADQQGGKTSDREITAQIRKSIMADKSLSTYAHNVKIITQHGMVTLKGPVRSDEEVKTIVAKATDVAGSDSKVVNQLSVKPSKP